MTKDYSSHGVNRREFITRMSGGTIGAGVAASLMGNQAPAAGAESKIERRNEQAGMAYSVLGRTNLSVSRLAYGGVPLNADRIEVFDRAVERGLNLVHMSRGYGKGQAIQALGTWLKKPGNRDKVFIMLSLSSDLDKDLETLNTDHADILTVSKHKVDDVKAEQIKHSFDAARSAGKARFLGLITHRNPIQCTQAAVDCGYYDFVVPPLGLTNLEPFRPVLDAAGQKKVGIVAMKSMQNSKGKGTSEEVVKGILASGVASILKGLKTQEEADQFLAGAAATPRTADLDRALELGREIVAAGGLCTLCGECVGCPRGVDVQSVLRNYQYYYEQLGDAEAAIERYGEMRVGETALACGDCGRCEEVCPMRIPVRRIIREAHTTLGAVT
jgi:predicted aldo/keto reductase-like oxidoreductase